MGCRGRQAAAALVCELTQDEELAYAGTCIGHHANATVVRWVAADPRDRMVSNALSIHALLIVREMESVGL